MSFQAALWAREIRCHLSVRQSLHLDLLRGVVDAGPRTLVHGDSHLGNVVRSSLGQPLLVDWQSARIGTSAGDIAFALTRAAAETGAVPRDRVIGAYSAAAGVEPDPTRRAVTAQQLLTLVEQYPEFADFLGTRDIDRLRRTFDLLLSEWADQG
ncbi:phosphotransferase family protein [Brachybacterium sacelli]|uniref:phosphotransferase family protein n=1 Tax=Brachybacterium sacelli TaxID=173364 RepID=UPI003614D3A7